MRAVDSFSSDYVREYILRSSQKEIDAKSSPSNRSFPPKDSIEDRHFLPPSLPSPLFGRRRPPEIQRHSRHERVTPTLAEREKANTKEREREEERRRDEEEEEEDAFYARLNV